MPKRNKRTKTQHGGLGCDIPVDLLIEILSRLPGSSLSRFRFVSKQWGTLITTNTHLQKLHLDLGFKSGSPIILVHSYKAKVKNHIRLISETGEPKSLVMCINKRYNRVSPSCNGLICVYNNFSVALVNPTTQQKRVLPKPPRSSTAWEWHNIFLGYTPTNKYKVVRFHDPSQCEVLTVGSCSWRQITASFEFRQDDFTGSVVLNGVMYLMAQSLKTKIVSFDLNVEKFDTIESPLLGQLPSIFELEGKICVAYYNSYDYGTMDIWILESIRSRDWNRKYKFMNPSTSHHNFQPVLIQGKIIVSSNEILNYCDAKTGVWAGSIYQEKFLYKLGAQFHFESFVNLKTL